MRDVKILGQNGLNDRILKYPTIYIHRGFYPNITSKLSGPEYGTRARIQNFKTSLRFGN